MTAAERYVRALREAADAFEEIYSGKTRKPRRRGLLPLDAPREIPADVQRSVDARLAANGYRRKS